MNKEISLELANKIVSNCDLIKYKVDYASFTRVGDANDFIKYHKNMLSEDSYKVTGDYGDYSCYVTTNDYDKLPSIADVIMWLYEKHGIWIYVDWMSRTSPYNSGFYSYLRGTNKPLNEDNWIPINDTLASGYHVFNSPTEAYETAIEYLLNLK